MLSKSDDHKIEEAIVFLVQSLQNFNQSTKPVLMHSLRIAYQLHSLGYERDIIITAILHDLIEDSSASHEEIIEKFGQRVFDMVSACTLDKGIKNHKARYMKSYNDADELGVACLVVRATDLIDNSYYYHLAQNEDLFNSLLEKFNNFITIAKPKLSQDKIWPILLDRKTKIESLKWGAR